MAPDNPQIVARDLSNPEAAELVDYLRERGFTPHVRGINPDPLDTPLLASTACVQIVVDASEAVRAREAIEEFRGRLLK
jgi:hypothetical protein